jgi:hypothetical protein
MESGGGEMSMNPSDFHPRTPSAPRFRIFIGEVVLGIPPKRWRATALQKAIFLECGTDNLEMSP